jgi:hypothetical protein
MYRASRRELGAQYMRTGVWGKPAASMYGVEAVDGHVKLDNSSFERVMELKYNTERL